MGTEEGLRGLMDELETLSKRIESGEIPKTAFPRYFYCGHKPLGGFTGTEWFKCSCGHAWSISESQYIQDFRNDRSLQYSCPACKKAESPQNILWYHDYDRRGKWECLKCKHQWISENGEVCPSCNLDYRQWNPQKP